MLVAQPVASTAFGSLFGGGDARRGSRERIVNEAAESCRASLNHTLGTSWLRCVLDDLHTKSREFKDDGRAFPLEALRAGEVELKALLPGGRPSSHTDELKNLMRNYSCDVADGGSQPLRSFVWTHTPVDPCAAGTSIYGPETGDGGPTRFAYHPGFLPAGNDLFHRQANEEEAKAICSEHVNCAGFTFSAEGARRPEQQYNMLFKSATEGQVRC